MNTTQKTVFLSLHLKSEALPEIQVNVAHIISLERAPLGTGGCIVVVAQRRNAQQGVPYMPGNQAYLVNETLRDIQRALEVADAVSVIQVTHLEIAKNMNGIQEPHE